MAVVQTPVIVAHCGLVCSECGAHRNGKCGGCQSDKPMFANCPVKRCSAEKKHSCCADCLDFRDLRGCRKLNNLLAKVLGFLFRSNRIGNLERIRQLGLDDFKAERAAGPKR